MESYVKIGGRRLKILRSLAWKWGGINNFQNHPYVINEWPLTLCCIGGGTTIGTTLNEQFLCLGPVARTWK